MVVIESARKHNDTGYLPAGVPRRRFAVAKPPREAKRLQPPIISTKSNPVEPERDRLGIFLSSVPNIGADFFFREFIAIKSVFTSIITKRLVAVAEYLSDKRKPRRSVSGSSGSVRSEQLNQIIILQSYSSMRVLQSCLHTMFVRIVVFYFGQVSDHTTFGNLKYPVEMQSVGITTAFPNSDILPTFPCDKVFQGVCQLFAERFFIQKFVRIGKSNKIVPTLQLQFAVQSNSSLYRLIFLRQIVVRFALQSLAISMHVSPTIK